MRQNERRARIKEYIDAKKEANISELIALCGNCSNMTLWRDLKAMEQDGAIIRTHGGVVSLQSLHPETESLYRLRAKQNAVEKRAIALAARAYVKSGVSVYFDSGSTLMSLAVCLEEAHYTIITSGANIAIELSKRRGCDIIALGGQINGNTLSCSGPQAEAMLDRVNIDTAIMATSGFCEASGFTSGSTSESEIKRRVVKKAARVIMLMDAGKIGRSLPFTFCMLKDVDVLIVDRPLPEELAALAKSAGAEVVLSEVRG